LNIEYSTFHQAREPFESGKCCGSGVTDKYFAWQISTLPFYDGGPHGVDEKWNIQCSKHSVISGFRFMADRSGVRVLSDVRCSMLLNKLVNESQCVVIDYSVQANISHAWNETWTHECPSGYAMTAVYDVYGFEQIQKIKCCNIIDHEIRKGWISDFSENLAGFEQSKKDDFDYTDPVQLGILVSPTYAVATQHLHYGALVSQAINIKEPVCLTPC
jgi:hypothetical protein